MRRIRVPALPRAPGTAGQTASPGIDLLPEPRQTWYMWSSPDSENISAARRSIWTGIDARVTFMADMLGPEHAPRSRAGALNPRADCPPPVALSVVIPVLDEAAHVAAVVADVAARCPGAEVLVVDGGSRDGTAEIAARQTGVRVLVSTPGRARQMNAGARAASGASLLFLHADTRLPPGAGDLVTRALARPGAVAGRFDVRFDSGRRVLRMVAFLMNVRSRWSRISTGDQAIFVRRDAFEALGGFPDIPLMEDVELTRRLKRVGRIVCLRERVVTAARKWEREGAWRTIALMWRLRLLYALGTDPARLHRMYYGRPPAPPGSAPGSG